MLFKWNICNLPKGKTQALWVPPLNSPFSQETCFSNTCWKWLLSNRTTLTRNCKWCQQSTLLSNDRPLKGLQWLKYTEKISYIYKPRHDYLCMNSRSVLIHAGDNREKRSSASPDVRQKAKWQDVGSFCQLSKEKIKADIFKTQRNRWKLRRKALKWMVIAFYQMIVQ